MPDRAVGMGVGAWFGRWVRAMAEGSFSTDFDGFAGWAIKLASAVDRHHDAACPQLVLDAVACLVPYDMAMIVVYSRGKKPVLIHDTFRDATAKRGLTNYVNDTYVLNPTYTAYRRGLEPGVYRITDLAPDAYFGSEHFKNLRIKRSRNEEIGYVTDGWPRDMEEIIIAVELPDDELGEVSLLRAASRGGFSEAGIAKLRSVEPVLGATFRQHWGSRRQSAHREEDSNSIEELFERVGGNLLSPREREVAELILKGHSSHSIGEHLGISITTVKTHRQNLYGKLGIATQFELFSVFLKSISPVTV